MSDLHQTGIETTGSILIWTIYYLATYPNVQEKLQKEIDQVLVGEQLATLEDRQRSALDL